MSGRRVLLARGLARAQGRALGWMQWTTGRRSRSRRRRRRRARGRVRSRRRVDCDPSPFASVDRTTELGWPGGRRAAGSRPGASDCSTGATARRGSFPGASDQAAARGSSVPPPPPRAGTGMASTLAAISRVVRILAPSFSPDLHAGSRPRCNGPDGDLLDATTAWRFGGAERDRPPNQEETR